ncbi:TIGR03936 family radical SAM-associated protein [Cellulosilyticum sp. I15G10I2]|uniref:TIGR03936 family radical SAM-associated protein n=1 Tax=Cellulosilyticum sp. I15G10I2 TaxID=1892843 RepID=UPI00085C4AED|nr:TIGR03936 family radical SAM-associated protein [Cellulosilyticum sp. I15G10I2]
MKIRLKFIKQGHVKFVGHLDTIRLFQRAIKVAGIPIAYSQGFNPHSLVYFAMPLSVGVGSVGEYMDIVTVSDMVPEKVKQMLNNVLVEGIHITQAFLAEEGSASLMSLVHAASYEIVLIKETFKELSKSVIEERLSREEIMIQKKGKKGMKTINIKPMILEYSINETPEHLIIMLKALAGSGENLSPQLFLKAILNSGDKEAPNVSITRKELYTYDQDAYIALENYRRRE